MTYVYYDSHLNDRVSDNSLEENRDYYIDLNGFEEDEVEKYFALYGMAGMYDWIPKSPAAKLRFTNYIGKCNIGSQTFYIRSKKFLANLTGEQQLALLLTDIEKWAAGLSLDVDSPSLTAKEVDWTKPSATLLHEFNYFYHAFFSIAQEERIPWLFERVVANPHFGHTKTREKDQIWKVKRTGNDFAKSLISGLGEFVEINKCSKLTRSHILNEYPAGRFNSVPLYVFHNRNDLTADTQENRFIRYFFEHIRTVSKRAGRAYSNSELITQRVKELLSHIRQILSNTFFLNIGQLTLVPISSTVLRYRHGYKEMYEHYFKAHMATTPRFYDAIDGQVSELKDVATLYEIWCFFNISKQVLRDNCIASKSDISIDGQKLLYEAEFRNEKYAVSYNRFFTRSDAGSYSLALRPDIVVEDLVSGELFVFDAKYRAVVEFDENKNIVSKKYQSSDVQKMHTYVDAITNCRASIALYVGDEFYFFRRANFGEAKRDVIDLDMLDGVGVIPLVPGRDNAELESLINKFFSNG